MVGDFGDSYAFYVSADNIFSFPSLTTMSNFDANIRLIYIKSIPPPKKK